MYAILDIETTGGQYNEEGITEIAIYRFDGHEVVDQFSSLVNPERPIQPYVSKLTGINDNMLRRAPKFYEVAKRVIEITQDCTIVAHNASFDRRILATEFRRLGYNYERESLCTIELAKKLIPGLPSYSLGKLTKHLGIPMTNRHRAHGDAKATVSLFKLLLAKDREKEIISKSVKEITQNSIKSKHLELIENAPTDLGVYYIYNQAKRIIYIGRGKNIKKKLTQHFTYDNNKSKRLQAEVASVAYEKTGSQLIALIKESEEIIKTKPLYNRNTRKRLYSHQLESTVNEDGYVLLKIVRADGRKRALMTFSNYPQADAWLTAFVEENNLYQNKSNHQKSRAKKSNGESPDAYNQRVREALSEHSIFEKDLLLIDRGRSIEERSLIWIANGKVKGYGFYDLNHQITNPEILKNIVSPIVDVQNATHIIQKHIQTHNVLKIVDLNSNSED